MRTKIALKIHVIVLTLLVATPALAANCGGELNSKPNRKTLGPGALLRLKAELKEVVVLDTGYTGTAPAPHVTAYAPDVPLHATEFYELKPGQKLRTLSGVLKQGDGPYRVKVALLPEGQEAVMYWVDIHNNAVVEQAGESVEQKSKAPPRKFPNKWDRLNERDLWARGQTAWGRPMAAVGQVVWLANHSRVMGRGSVGTLVSVDEEGTFGTVQTLDGASKPELLGRCVPLTEEEIAWFN